MKLLKPAVMLLAYIGLFAIASLFVPRDDTDSPDERSGMVPYTDHKTGCQYLKAGGIFTGNLTPRLGADGKQVCIALPKGIK